MRARKPSQLLDIRGAQDQEWRMPPRRYKGDFKVVAVGRGAANNSLVRSHISGLREFASVMGLFNGAVSICTNAPHQRLAASHSPRQKGDHREGRNKRSDVPNPI